jgi:Predicted membrane protein (DUF2339)
VEILAIIAIIAVVISHRSLSSRLGSLEAKVKNGVQVKEDVPVFVPVAPQPQPVAAQTVITGGMEEYVGQPNTLPAMATFVAAQPRQPDPLERFVIWFKEDWLMKLGAFLFIIGCGVFVSYAFANGWIDEAGRIAIGIIAGVFVMAFGFWRTIRFPSQGAIFMALGAGMAILSIFAGRAIYGFFTPASAIAFDFIIVAFVSFASYKFNIRSLALSAQILAFVSPLLAAGQTESVFLFSYLLFISLATLILAGLMGWRGLILSSLVFVGMYSLPYIFSPQFNSEAPIILNFAYIFAMLYLISGMFAVVMRGVENAEDAKNELVLAVLNGLFLFLWIAGAAEKEWHALIFSACAIIFAVCSFIAFRLSSKLHPFYAYGSVAAAFIAAATAALLDGAALIIAFSIEVLILVAVVLALIKSVRAASSTLLLFFVPVILSLPSMSRYLGQKELFTQDFFVFLVLSICLILAGRLIGNAERENTTKENSPIWQAAIIFGTAYTWFIIWGFVHSLIPLQGAAVTIASSVETLILVAVVLALTKSVGAASSTLILFFVPILLAFASMTRYLNSQELFTGDFFVLLILALSLIFAGRLVGNVERGNATKTSSPVWQAAIIFGTVYIWFVIWSFVHILIPPPNTDMATFVALAIYTVVGLWAYFDGLYGNDTARRVYGAMLLIFVVVRLLAVDVWAMKDILSRVITFFSIGILLMSTAFFSKKKKSE